MLFSIFQTRLPRASSYEPRALLLVQVEGAVGHPAYQVVASVRLKVPQLSHGEQFTKYSVTPPLLLHQWGLTLTPLLDTPPDKRNPYLEPELCAFPYTNGGLFKVESVKWKMGNEVAASTGVDSTLHFSLYTLPTTSLPSPMRYASFSSAHRSSTGAKSRQPSSERSLNPP